jgi:hypothetical protein
VFMVGISERRDDYGITYFNVWNLSVKIAYHPADAVNLETWFATYSNYPAKTFACISIIA